MTQLPFQELTIANIRRIIDLCEGIRRFYQEKYPTGFKSVDECIDPVLPLQQWDLDQLYERLTPVARQELIALKLFGNRGTVWPNHWQADLREASRLVNEPHVLESDCIDLYLKQGLRNMKRVSLIERNPLE